MFPHLHRYHKLIPFLTFFAGFLLCSTLSFAQEVADTTIYLEEEAEGPSTVIVEDSEAISVDEYYKPDEVDYFTLRSEQEDSGPPRYVELRTMKDSFMVKLKREDAFWYVDYDFSRKKKDKKSNESLSESRPIPEGLLWMIIVGGFLGFLFIYLSNSNVGLFRRGSRALAQDSDGDVISENIFEINYEKEIEKAIQKGDLGLGVRLLFLRTLKSMSEKRIIKYQQDRTNFDYLMQLHGSSYYEEFFQLTRSYEYTWYGKFAITSEVFGQIRNDFDNFEKRIRNN